MVTSAHLRLPAVWFWLSSAAALLAGVASAVGLLLADRVYGRETTVLADAAAAQDIVNLVLVAPLLVVLGISAARGSVRAYLCWLGCLVFTVYNYAIYAFSIHFGPLFLAWVAVLGLAFYAAMGGLANLATSEVERRFAGRAMPGVAWSLMVLAAVFALLWLSEIVPDLVAGGSSSSADDWRIPTNPVHVLDLALFLPGVFASGALLLRRNRLGYATAPGGLVFMALTCLPILVTPLVSWARGHDAPWAVVGPVGITFLATTAILGAMLRRVGDEENQRQRGPDLVQRS